MDRWSGRVAIVTGASSGIGAAIAEELVKYGMIVIGCARNVGSIEDLASKLSCEKGRLVALKCDVRREDEILAVFQRAKDEFGGVDVCVNNAGVEHNQPLLSGDTEEWREMLEVNVLGVAICTREAVKSMREKGVDDGHVINMNSMSGRRLTGKPASNFYGASKFALTAMTEGVRIELRQQKSNIRISQICPGRVATGFRQRMMKITPEENKEYYERTPHLVAKDVADALIYQLSAPAHVQVHDVLVRPTEQNV